MMNVLNFKSVYPTERTYDFLINQFEDSEMLTFLFTNEFILDLALKYFNKKAE